MPCSCHHPHTRFPINAQATNLPSARLQGRGYCRLGTKEQQDIPPVAPRPAAWAPSSMIFMVLPSSAVLCSYTSIFKPEVQTLKRFRTISEAPELGRSSTNTLGDCGLIDVVGGVRKPRSSAEGYGPTAEPARNLCEHPASAPVRSPGMKGGNKNCYRYFRSKQYLLQTCL